MPSLMGGRHAGTANDPSVDHTIARPRFTCEHDARGLLLVHEQSAQGPTRGRRGGLWVYLASIDPGHKNAEAASD